MSQKVAAMEEAFKFSKKCSACGLKNFAHASLCMRCKSDLSGRSAVTKVNKQISDNSGERHEPRLNRAFIFSGALVILIGLVSFYVRQEPATTPEAISEVPAAQTQISDSEPTPDPARQEAQSGQAATHALAGLKHFQSATRSNITYDEYDQMLTELKSELNSTLPSFVSHKPTDETFRQEVAAAVGDYSAAANWWKTTIRNSGVLTEADRIERLQAEWNSAQTHLDNAERVLRR
jgi:hypothetical protein